MTDKTLRIILGIIAVNLTIQTVKDVGLFPAAYAQSGVQKIAICNEGGGACTDVVRQSSTDRNTAFPIINYSN
tara:strand:+ start:306 stop:524 length:219 start_codon:yes stop_codon:yes gene_type:complete